MFFFFMILYGIIIILHHTLSDGEEKSAISFHNINSTSFLTESVFSNIEELRVELENELGFDLFVKVYKLIQVFYYFFNSSKLGLL